MTQSTAKSTTNSIQDRFDGDDFAPQRPRLPWLQVLHSEDPGKSGFFITLENCEASAISIPDNWQPFKARFKSGEVDRCLVCRRCHDPFSDTLQDKLRLLRERLSSRRADSNDELPF